MMGMAFVRDRMRVTCVIQTVQTRCQCVSGSGIEENKGKEDRSESFHRNI